MNKKIETEVYLTPRQAAEHFNLSLSTIKNYIYAGKLKTLKTPGGHHRISKNELLATLGHKNVSTAEEVDIFSLKLTLCNAMLAVFRILGSAGSHLALHAHNVSELSSELARKMSMNDSEVRLIEIAGLMHDIGHIGIERHVLLKSSPLTSDEYESVKNHPSIGEDVLRSIKELRDTADIVAQHHERMDGRGYPNGLDGEKIRKEARIIAIAEAYDAMVSPRSYREHVSKEEALAELLQNKGAQFDTEIVEIFTKII
jgi:excisionase family DNA binding protein/putative nucleotidyltransferase with HDIG domain